MTGEGDLDARHSISADDGRRVFSWLENQPRRPRYELIAGEPVEMSPERVRHAR